MPLSPSATILSLTFVTAALAQSGVQNADVQKRMQLMEDIRDTMVALDTMATGEAPFNAALADRLAQSLAADAAAIPVHFEFQFEDPESAARPEIWSDWPGFAEAAARTEAAAAGLPTGSPRALRRGMAEVRRTCDACHGGYRADDQG